MLTVDAAPFYDLPEASRLLWADPARLARRAALGAVPATWVAGALALPKAWVDAESGRVPGDAEGLRARWLARLAAPSLDARRAVRPVTELPPAPRLTLDEACRALFSDRARLERLHGDGTLPAVRVDGVLLWDGPLVDALLAEAADGPAGGPVAAARRALVATWARSDYASPPPPPAPPAPPEASPPAPSSRLSKADGFLTIDEP